MGDDPTKHPNFAGVMGSDGTFYPPDRRTRARQKAHFKREIYSGLEYMLSGQVVFLNNEPASGVSRIEEAAEMLTSSVPADADSEELAARVMAFTAKAAKAGTEDSEVREAAKALLSELEPFAHFDFWSDADPPGWTS